MSGWVKMDKDLPDTMRFRRVVRKVKESNALRGVTNCDDAFYVSAVIGALYQLWRYADSHISDDNTLEASVDEINQLVGVDGFAQALPADWLQVVDTNHIQLPDFLAHNGTSAKQRRDAARRQATYRHRHSQRNVTQESRVTNASDDARPDQTRRDQTKHMNAHARARDVSHGTSPEDEPASARQPESEVEIASHIARIRAIYPRAQREDWISAEKRIRELVLEGAATWLPLEQGVERYAALVRATGRLVLNPARYFGDVDRPWAQDWPLPAAPADVAAEQRRARDTAALERVKARALRIGCPLKPRLADSAESYDSLVSDWERSRPALSPGPAPLLTQAAAR